MRIILIILPLLLLTSFKAQARVFDFKNESVATYFRGTAGMSMLQKTAFEKAGAADMTYSDQANYNYSGEFGVLFSLSRTNIRLGAEIFRPNAVTNAEATDASDGLMYNIDSAIISYGGVLNLDFNLMQGERSRLFFSAGAGYFTTTLKNDFRFSPAGAATYSIANYVEEGSAVSIMGQASFGYEFLLSDSVTAIFDAGYRSFLVNSLKHGRDATTLNGAVTSGQTMQNNDGSDRSLDLGGIWVGLGLRFYIALL